MRPNVAVLVLLLTASALPFSAAVTRLPQNVIPSHYAITITPDLQGETFQGEETIDVEIGEPVDSITMHAVDLTLGKVTIEAAGKLLTETSTFDTASEMVTMKLPEILQPGAAAIHIVFSGHLGQQLNGLYLSRTARRKYAVTQFEARSARKAFPCFDEPAMKATFDITLVVDSGDTAISNGAIVSDTPSGAGKHALRFGTTRKMSTYLVAMLVGDFVCIEASADAIPIRVCTTPGLEHFGHFALDAARVSVMFFNRYYGINYPFGKLDLIGIPDFAAGAMENAGAITFRETDLLIDQQTASSLVQKRVAEVVSHEIAHQWFGDLVTMKWWDDIWLNEGFATFMSTKPTEAWKPQWRADLDKPAATDEALSIDSLRSTQPIRTPANAEGSGFGNAGIIYGKTASVLRMVEEWIGPDAFRDAIRVYLKKYSWGNAAAEDFWSTMKASSQQPIDTVLESFIDLTGAPLLHVTESCDATGRRVTIAQERALPRDESAAAESWSIPICAHVVGAKTNEPCHIVAKKDETLLLRDVVGEASGSTSKESCSQPLFLSRNGSGYFLVDYSKSERNVLRDHLSDLTPAERISYQGNEWLLVKGRRRDAGEYLTLLRAMPKRVERPLVTGIADNLGWLDQRLVDDHNRAAWQAYVHQIASAQAPVSWDAPAGETPEDRISRGAVLWTLGNAANDADVIAGARKVAEQYMKNPASVDAVIAERALRLSAIHGDPAFYGEVVEQLSKASTPELTNRYRTVLTYFRDPKVMPGVIDYIYSDRVRTQDLPIVTSAMFNDPATRPAAWAAAKAHWAEIVKKSPGAAGRLVGATGQFCDPEARKDVEAFFKEHVPPGGERGLNRALDAIDGCIAFRAAQQQSFDEAIGAHAR
jgi:aminopeptidase N